MLTTVRKYYKLLMSDSLYRNSFYLMASTGVMAVLGFLFWVIVSRLYSAEDVGLATTIISAMGLITSFSLLGLNSGLIRFLPSSERKNDKINTCFALAAFITIIVTTIFLLGLNGFSPKLLFIKKNIIYSFIFIIFMVFATLSSLLDSIFISYRSTGYVLIKNSIFSSLKLIFPVMFVYFGAYGIFGSWMVSLMIAFSVSFLFLTFRFGYKPKFVFYDSILYKIGKFSFGNYIAGFIGGFATLLLPIIITNLHQTATTAYYFIAMNIAIVLYIIPQATTSALFAEGSKNQSALKSQIKKATKIISALMIPGIIIVFLFGKYVLSFFGADYAENGFMFLQLLSISGIFVGINSIYGAILKVKKKVGLMILMSIINSLIVVSFSYYSLFNDFGLTGIGYAFLFGQITSSIIYVFIIRK